MNLLDYVFFTLVALIGGAFIKLALDLLVAKKIEDIQNINDTDEIYKNFNKEVYRIVKGKTLGGEIKYFVEKKNDNKCMAFEGLGKETIDEARELKDWLISEDEQKINNTVLEKKVIE
ncbi:hypothetical protein N42HA_01463 [Lactococcus lactis]|uniref:Uncharacterized protein n=1 Tax=Lactococcus lactis subsp. lactis TaxID=1360 RepID=A0A0V8EUP1_LACLL|nr:hypothetical protein [Lactococcus lactis]KSU29082.1 hypothetical protein N42_0550 [Lactococcus lactis subsp. lactis]MDU0408450.1 hypothetical protein [Lactococcus lactis]NRD16242.1 hypothetical protein [Lactococcus lactis subsp. lactis]